MKKLKRLIAVLLAVMLSACSTPAPAPESAIPTPPAEISAPESVSGEAPAQPETENGAGDVVETVGSIVPLDSIRIWQQAMTGEVYWELLVIEPEEIQLMEGLLSVKELSPLEGWEEKWPDGGTPLLFELREWGGDGTVIEACTYPQGAYRIKSEDGRSTLRIGEEYYAYPGERCDALLKFLGEREIAIIS